MRYFILLLSVIPISAQDFADRRARLMEASPNGLVIVFARADRPQYLESGYRESANFYYLTGMDALGAVLVLDVPKKESWLFRNGDAPFEHAAKREEFEPFVRKRLKEKVKILYDTVPGKGEELARQFPKVRIESRRAKLLEMRWVKSASEIAALRRATMAGTAALRAGMRGISAGRSQREVEPEVVASCVLNGAEGQSFWPWIMSGPNSVYPAPTGGWNDYSFLNRTMQAGELVYLDLGCADGHYESDLGRTVPVSGKFTPEQREVYDLLVRGFQAARAAIKPGATVADVKKVYYDIFRSAQVKSDLAKAAVASELAEAQENKMFLLHGVGLDPVENNDGFAAGGRLVPGVVMALEPMVMLPQFKMGFQIEDMLLVTEKGNELLSPGLPYTADEVEEFLATPARANFTVIDAHNHIGPNKPAERLVSRMNVLGMSKSIIFSGATPTNEYTVAAAAKFPDRLIPFYRDSVRLKQDLWLKNDPSILAELERELGSGKYRGIGEFTNVHYPPGFKYRNGEGLLDTEVSPMAPMSISMFRLAEKYKLPVLMHNEVYYYREMDELLSKFPNVKVIWAHAGYTSWYGVDMLLKKHPNLYADLSIRGVRSARDGRDAQIFYDDNRVKANWLDLIERYPDRFIAGLDDSSQNYNGLENYFGWMAKLVNQLTPATARKVAWENMERILGSP